MSIQANLKAVLLNCLGVRLVAVSKFHPNEALEEVYLPASVFSVRATCKMTRNMKPAQRH